MDTPAVALAGRAAELSTDLYALSEHCGHDETTSDISNISEELAFLSTTLWRLHEAMVLNSEAYTTAFNEDLDEITSELTLVFDEIGECCTEMSKSDTPTTTTVGWFFKKGRVARLHKHLDALKTTLVVMRTVLHHGRDYGVQTSPGRLAESTPHTMYEDRAILDSIFAKNRRAIMNLHHHQHLPSHNHTSSTSSASAATLPETFPTNSDISESFSPGAHGQNLPKATGIEIPPIPDVLPSKPTGKPKPDTSLSRRFSKRGVRLGVHMSILDLGAHDAPTSLRKKWIAKAHAQTQAQVREGGHGHAVSMSTIAEDSTQPMEHIEAKYVAAGSSGNDGGQRTPPRRSDSEESASKARRRANSLMTSPVGNALSKVIRRLSLSSVRKGQGDNEIHTRNSGESTEGVPGDHGIGNETSPGATTKRRLSHHFIKPELNTPDYNQEFENGRWW